MRNLSLAAMSAALALSACGSGDDSSANQADSETSKPDTPAAIVKAAFDCATLPRSDARTDNDIMNIDLGMSATDALKIAKCNKEGFEADFTSDVANFPDGSSAHTIIRMRKEGDLVNVFLIGSPNQERVYGLVREKKFAEGEEPVIEQMRGQLTGKYGSLIQARTFAPDASFTARDPNEQAQAFTPEGQPAPENTVNNSDCTQTFGQNQDLAQVSSVCGFTKKFAIRPKYGNAALASGFSVWIGDQSAIMRAAQEMRIAAQTMQQEKLQSERDRAASSNRAPTL